MAPRYALMFYDARASRFLIGYTYRAPIRTKSCQTQFHLKTNKKKPKEKTQITPETKSQTRGYVLFCFHLVRLWRRRRCFRFLYFFILFLRAIQRARKANFNDHLNRPGNDFEPFNYPEPLCDKRRSVWRFCFFPVEGATSSFLCGDQYGAVAAVLTLTSYRGRYNDHARLSV